MDQRIGRKNVKNFIITAMYGTAGNWAHETIVLSEFEESKNVSRNNEDQHAEEVFLADLKDTVINRQVELKGQEINAKLVQNYSPCEGCADKILKFQQYLKKELEITFSLTITFANFYNHKTKGNLKGLMKLMQNDNIELKLLQGEAWKEFLNDEGFVELEDKEKKEFLRDASSEKRKNREYVDQGMLEILLALQGNCD